MAKNNSGITIDGIKPLEARLNNLSNGLQIEVDAEMSASALTLAEDAARRAAVDDNRLRNSIAANTTTKFKKFVSVNANYAAYVEFGTGVHAASYVPGLAEPIQRYAMSFYINGQGRSKQQPFLIPALNKELPLLIQRIKNILEGE